MLRRSISSLQGDLAGVVTAVATLAGDFRVNLNKISGEAALDGLLIRLLEALRRESSFEGAAELALRAGLARVDASLGPGAGVHAGWLQLGAGAPLVVVPGRAEPPWDDLASAGAAAWALVQQHRAPLGLDLARGRAWSASGEVHPFSADLRGVGAATKLLVVPLSTPGSRLDGMLGVAVEAPGALAPSSWPALARELQAIADALAPALALLPRRARDEVQDYGPWLPVVGRAMAPVIHTLDAYARLDELLLLRGPTGTGKSRLAFWCWQRSPRAGARFVTANLLGVPDTAQESELFGVRKGTFTGVGERAGVVAAAQNGTLFIDEIDKLSLGTQAKLLRLVDERRYRVLGEAGDKNADVRFIVASNADLERLVAEGRFLEDLYFRINVLPVRVPPLHQRKDEIGPWAVYLARTLHQGRTGNDAVDLSPLAVEFLVEQPWPGNLRQLHNVVRRAYAFACLDAQGPAATEAPGEVLVSRGHVVRALGEEPPPTEEVGTGPPSLQAMREAARGVVAMAERRRAAGLPPLSERDGDLELADAFRGLVLQIATEQTGDIKKAFALFGLEGRLKGGNHLRTWRQAEEKLEVLKRIIEGG